MFRRSNCGRRACASNSQSRARARPESRSRYGSWAARPPGQWVTTPSLPWKSWWTRGNRRPSESDFDRTAREHHLASRLAAHQARHDVSPHRRKHLGTVGQPQAQASLAIVPVDIDAHELALAKIETLPVVFIEREGAVGARMDPQRQRAVDLLFGVLLHRAHGNHGAGADVERRGFE